MSKNWSWKGTGLSLNKKCACSDNPGQNIWNKIEKTCKTCQEKNSLVLTFACFLTAITKVKFSGGRLGTRVCVHPNLRFC